MYSVLLYTPFVGICSSPSHILVYIYTTTTLLYAVHHGSVSGKMNFGFRRARSRIAIDLDQPSVHAFTTGDHINGTATLTVDHDLHFDEIEITFEGMFDINLQNVCHK